jgi:hypothetical protein
MITFRALNAEDIIQLHQTSTADQPFFPLDVSLQCCLASAPTGVTRVCETVWPKPLAPAGHSLVMQVLYLKCAVCCVLCAVCCCRVLCAMCCVLCVACLSQLCSHAYRVRVFMNWHSHCSASLGHHVDTPTHQH